MKKVFGGLWWLPSNPEIQWYGKLRWQSEESPCLKLHYKSEEASAAPPEGGESLLGISAAGTPISLLRVGYDSATDYGYLSRKRYRAGHLLKGIHVPRLADVRLNRVNFWLQNLGAWLGEEGINYSETPDGRNRIEYRRPDDREYVLTEKLTLKICHNSTMSMRSRERKLSYDIFFALEHSNQISFNRAFRWINFLRNFLHFAQLRPLHATAMTIENSDHRFDLGGESFPKEVYVYGNYLREPLEKDPHALDFVLPSKTLKIVLRSFSCNGCNLA